MKTYEALAKAFAKEGTTGVFGLMGSTNQYWINALHRIGIPMYEVRHEGPGLSMAEGFGQITGNPGVCTTTSGPGAAQLATTMIIASRNHSPLVAFCGDEQRGATTDTESDSQSLNLNRFAAAIEAGFVKAGSPGIAHEAVQKAFYLARTESRPIILSVPIRTQLAPFDEDDEYVPSTSFISTKPMFPNPEAIDQAADLLASSSRPVILVGHGAIKSGAGEVVTRLAKRSGALIASSLMAINWPQNSDEFHVGVSGLYSTRVAMELFQEADCVIAAGASLNHYTLANGLLFPDAKFVQFDTEPGIVMGTGEFADCYVQSDVHAGLDQLDRALESRGFQQEGFRTASVRERLKTALEDPVEYEIQPGTLDPRDASRVFDDELPSDISLFIGGGSIVSIPIMLCRKSRPHILHSRGFAAIGKGLGEGIGASIALGGPVAILTGDAGFMMHLGEFETAARYNVPIFVAVMNDLGIGSERRQADHKLAELDPALTHIPTPDLGDVGRSLGGRGHLVRTLDDLRGAIKDFVANPGPMLVDIRISPNVDPIQDRRLHGRDDV